MYYTDYTVTYKAYTMYSAKVNGLQISVLSTNKIIGSIHTRTKKGPVYMSHVYSSEEEAIKKLTNYAQNYRNMKYHKLGRI